MRSFVFLSCLTATTVFSATITPSTFAGAYLCLDRTHTALPGCDIANVGPGSTSAASLSGTYGATQGAKTTVSATSNVGYGIFRVADSTTLDITGAPTLALSYATGNFQDALTISYAPLTGQQGFIYIGYTLDGTVSSSGINHAFTDVSIKVGSALEQSAFAVYQSPVSGLFYFPTFTFTYGQPFGINLAITAYTGTVTPRTTQTGAFFNYLQGAGIASSDFSNTLILSSLIVSDPGGNVVSGPQFSSGSGTLYTTSGVVTPEPSTMAFFCIGLVSLGAYLRFLDRRRAAVPS